MGSNRSSMQGATNVRQNALIYYTPTRDFVVIVEASGSQLKIVFAWNEFK